MRLQFVKATGNNITSTPTSARTSPEGAAPELMPNRPAAPVSLETSVVPLSYAPQSKSIERYAVDETKECLYCWKILVGRREDYFFACGRRAT